MVRKKTPRTVYSTDSGRVCPSCGWPAKQCHCSSTFDEPVPDRITARLRIEKAGRRGKTVTVVESLPRNAEFLKDLAKESKRACGTRRRGVENRLESKATAGKSSAKFFGPRAGL